MKKRDSFSNLSIIAILFAVLITLASIIAYKALINSMRTAAPTKARQFDYHFTLIVDAYDDPLWDAVWRSANAYAMENGAYIQWLGRDMPAAYSPEQLMEIAIAAGTDGILVRAGGSEAISERIQQAAASGIPVITVMTDALESSRQGYVGFNSYELGQLYGAQLLSCLPEDRPARAALLIDGEAVSGKSIVYSGIIEATGSRNIAIDMVTLGDTSMFGAEEKIRELVTSEKDAPDMLICLDATSTICAKQAVVDYNRVGRVGILGSYATGQILSALKKDIIQATVAVDAEKVGAAAAGALLECKLLGRTSDYLAVDMMVITRENADAYIAAHSESEAEDEG